MLVIGRVIVSVMAPASSRAGRRPRSCQPDTRGRASPTVRRPIAFPHAPDPGASDDVSRAALGRTIDMDPMKTRTRPSSAGPAVLVLVAVLALVLGAFGTAGGRARR